jgi:hypothetical protein
MRSISNWNSSFNSAIIDVLTNRLGSAPLKQQINVKLAVSRFRVHEREQNISSEQRRKGPDDRKRVLLPRTTLLVSVLGPSNLTFIHVYDDGPGYHASETAYAKWSSSSQRT